jgi:hypothetical protein
MASLIMKRLMAPVLVSLLGLVPSSIAAPAVETHDGCDLSEADIATVEDLVRDLTPLSIERFVCGQYAHPVAGLCVRVYFETEVFGTYVLERRALVMRTDWLERMPEPFRRWAGPPDDTEGWYLPRRPIRMDVKRRVKAGSQHVDFRLANDVSYAEARTVIEAILDGTYENETATELPSLDWTRLVCAYRGNETEVALDFETARFTGITLMFSIEGGKVVCTGTGLWAN